MNDATRIPAAGELRWLNPDDCKPHPNNPRLQLRDDIVQQIAFQLSTDGFQAHHAITVRPYDGGFQIVAGHQRVEAARQAGVDVAAWIVNMDDDTAFMQLVLSNTQGELDPLERGMHALDYVDAYKNGGISAYAARVGVTQASISQIRAAAAVARKYKTSYTLLGRSNHLLEISKADELLWTLLVEAMVDRGWSVRDTKAHVEAVNEFAVPQEYEHDITTESVVRRHLNYPDFSARTFNRYIASLEQIRSWIRDNSPDAATQAKYRQWLKDDVAKGHFDYRDASSYLQQLIAEQWTVEGWHHGDWRDHLDSVEDGSVALLLTDPPYGINYQSNRRVVSDKHQLIQDDDGNAAALLEDMLHAFHDKLADDAHIVVFTNPETEQDTIAACTRNGYTIKSQMVWDKQQAGMGDLQGSFAPSHERMVHAVKGKPTLTNRVKDVFRYQRPQADRHPTEKPVELLADIIEASTAPGTVIADPFGGVASTAVAAKQTGRRWWSCEVSAEYHAAGEERLA